MRERQKWRLAVTRLEHQARKFGRATAPTEIDRAKLRAAALLFVEADVELEQALAAVVERARERRAGDAR